MSFDTCEQFSDAVFRAAHMLGYPRELGKYTRKVADFLMNQTVQHYIGYDPGGNDKHGFAVLTVKGRKPCALCVDTLATTEMVLAEIGKRDLAGLGVDTLTCWSTGESGWRPADQWLRDNYPKARNSVMPPNALRGSMCVNGMAAIFTARKHHPKLYVTETHPKVVYLAMTKEEYNFAQKGKQMIDEISCWAGTPVKVSNEHEWDAAISALAAYYGRTKEWQKDLHCDYDADCGERLIWPAGNTCYAWPDEE